MSIGVNPRANQRVGRAVIGASAVALALAGCGGTRSSTSVRASGSDTASSSTSDSSVSSTTDVSTSSTVAADHPAHTIDWNNPLEGGGKPTDAATAKGLVNYGVDVPTDAGAVSGMWITTSDAQVPTLVFELTPASGRVLLYRAIAQTTQADLDAFPQNHPQAAGSAVALSTVPIPGGPNGLAIVGPQYLSLDWLEGNVRITLIGEVSNYSLDRLLAEAKTLYGSATAVAR